MRSACVFPPNLNDSKELPFSAANVCSALIAYLHRSYPEDPCGTLKQFGFESSTQIGTVVKAIQENRKTRIVSNWKIEASDFEGLFSAGAIDRQNSIRWSLESEENCFERTTETHRILRQHFDSVSLDELVVSKRKFPEHVRADLQLALDQVFCDHENFLLHGLNQKYAHEGISFRSLIETDKGYQVKIGPLAYTEVDVGADRPVSCLVNGLWLAVDGNGTPFAVVLGSGPTHFRSPNVQIEYVTCDAENAQTLPGLFFETVQQQIESSTCYRGKILPFEQSDDYHGRVAELKVHELKQIEREQVILPERTLELLDRNVIDFVRQRPELKKRGMDLKKGLLFFGPPGTGKTHTVHYLSRALPDTTALVITSEQIGLLSRYMTLARLLQPSLVIIEDADLIARQREEIDTCQEVLLNKLLNEMDGLRADAEIVFVLTTNRPEVLEKALTSRPGRIDQAIEFPLPDENGRRQLAKLYAGNQTIDSDAIELIVSKTEHTSAAFIKELMSRATQYAIARCTDGQVETADIELAVEELLLSGGAFNRRILGALYNQE
ncbi:MAG: ATP-binding protein [Planctomycetota bacterium]